MNPRTRRLRRRRRNARKRAARGIETGHLVRGYDLRWKMPVVDADRVTISGRETFTQVDVPRTR